MIQAQYKYDTSHLTPVSGREHLIEKTYRPNKHSREGYRTPYWGRDKKIYVPGGLMGWLEWNEGGWGC